MPDPSLPRNPRVMHQSDPEGSPSIRLSSACQTPIGKSSVMCWPVSSITIHLVYTTQLQSDLLQSDPFPNTLSFCQPAIHVPAHYTCKQYSPGELDPSAVEDSHLCWPFLLLPHQTPSPPNAPRTLWAFFGHPSVVSGKGLAWPNNTSTTWTPHLYRHTHTHTHTHSYPPSWPVQSLRNLRRQHVSVCSQVFVSREMANLRYKQITQTFLKGFSHVVKSAGL